MKELEELTREIREKLPRLIKTQQFHWKTVSEEITVYEEPMLNDIMDWMPFVDERELLLDYYGNIGEIICDRGGYYLNPLAKWDLSLPYLKDQSPELIKFLHGLINH